MTDEQMIRLAQGREYLFTFAVVGGRSEGNALRIRAANIEQAKLRAKYVADRQSLRVRLQRVTKRPV